MSELEPRTSRAKSREVNKYFKKNGDDGICAICTDSLVNRDTMTANVCVTVCGHGFHTDCWIAYTTSHRPDVPQNDEPPEERLRKIGIWYVTAFAGPPCPICRQDNPTIHHLARRTADANLNSRGKLERLVRDLLGRDGPLRLASMKLPSP